MALSVNIMMNAMIILRQTVQYMVTVPGMGLPVIFLMPVVRIRNLVREPAMKPLKAARMIGLLSSVFPSRMNAMRLPHMVNKSV